MPCSLSESDTLVNPLFVLFCCLLMGVGVAPLWADTAWSVSTHHKKVAFTFDDGPKPEHAIPLIQRLQSLQVRATFFLVGQEIKNNIDLVRRLHDQGHEVANHGYTHRRLPPMDPAAIQAELRETNRLIYRATGQWPRFFRPPGGQFNPSIIGLAAAEGLKTILWNVNAKDYVGHTARFPVPDEWRVNGQAIHPRDAITDAVIQGVTPGSIVLMHNGGDVLKALPNIVAQLRAKGYDIVTVGELLAHGVAVSGPQSYTVTGHVPD